QTMLIALVWGALFFMAGMRMIWVGGLAGTAAVGMLGAYAFVPHVRARISRFMDPSAGDNYQVGNAVESFIRGGWFGRGPGEGTGKRILPASHHDFCSVARSGRGILPRALPRAGHAVLLHRDSRAAACLEGPRPVHALCDCGLGDP